MATSKSYLKRVQFKMKLPHVLSPLFAQVEAALKPLQALPIHCLYGSIDSALLRLSSDFKIMQHNEATVLFDEHRIIVIGLRTFEWKSYGWQRSWLRKAAQDSWLLTEDQIDALDAAADAMRKHEETEENANVLLHCLNDAGLEVTPVQLDYIRQNVTANNHYIRESVKALERKMVSVVINTAGRAKPAKQPNKSADSDVSAVALKPGFKPAIKKPSKTELKTVAKSPNKERKLFIV